ncbi:unnamed protein product [Prunus brigantina]
MLPVICLSQRLSHACYNLNPLTRIHWRASPVPAAAVIPAPTAYIKVVAVKKLVVGPWVGSTGPPPVCTGRLVPSTGDTLLALIGRVVPPVLLL